MTTTEAEPSGGTDASTSRDKGEDGPADSTKSSSTNSNVSESPTVHSVSTSKEALDLRVSSVPAPEDGSCPNNNGTESTKSGNGAMTNTDEGITSSEKVTSTEKEQKSPADINEGGKDADADADADDKDDSDSREKILFLLKVASDPKGGGNPNETKDKNDVGKTNKESGAGAASSTDGAKKIASRSRNHRRDDKEKPRKKKAKKAKTNASAWPGYNPTAAMEGAGTTSSIITGMSNQPPPLPQSTVHPLGAGAMITGLLAGVGNRHPPAVVGGGGGRYGATELAAAGIANGVGTGAGGVGSGTTAAAAAGAAGAGAATGPVPRTTRRRRRKAVPRKRTFAEKLMMLLTDPECSEAVEWLPDGTAFVITNPLRFADLVLPKYFKSAKYESFTRKLNRWGFKRMSRAQTSAHATAADMSHPSLQDQSNSTAAVYCHHLFHRDHPDLCSKMKGDGGLRATDEEREAAAAFGLDPRRAQGLKDLTPQQIIERRTRQLEQHRMSTEERRRQSAAAAAAAMGATGANGLPTSMGQQRHAPAVATAVAAGAAGGSMHHSMPPLGHDPNAGAVGGVHDHYRDSIAKALKRLTNNGSFLPHQSLHHEALLMQHQRQQYQAKLQEQQHQYQQPRQQYQQPQPLQPQPLQPQPQTLPQQYRDHQAHSGNTFILPKPDPGAAAATSYAPAVYGTHSAQASVAAGGGLSAPTYPAAHGNIYGAAGRVGGLPPGQGTYPYMTGTTTAGGGGGGDASPGGGPGGRGAADEYSNALTDYYNAKMRLIAARYDAGSNRVVPPGTGGGINSSTTLATQPGSLYSPNPQPQQQPQQLFAPSPTAAGMPPLLAYRAESAPTTLAASADAAAREAAAEYEANLQAEDDDQKGKGHGSM